MKGLLFLLSLALTALPSTAAQGTLRMADAVRQAVYVRAESTADFDLTGDVSYCRREDGDNQGVFVVEDGSGAVDLHVLATGNAACPAPGARVRCRGKLWHNKLGKRLAVAQKVTVLRTGVPIPPRNVSAADLLRGDHDCRLCRLAGTVIDVCVSELNAKWIVLVVNSGGERLCASLPGAGKTLDAFERLIDADVVLTGVCVPHDLSSRKRIGRIFKLADDSAITVRRPASDRATVPSDVSALASLRPSEIAKLGRHRALGRILATWGRNNALLKTADGELLGLEFAREILPAGGDTVEVCGFPESTLHNINLVRATWRRTAPLPPENSPPETLSARQLLSADGNGMIDVSRHGQLVRLTGTVVALPTPVNGDSRLFVESDGVVVPVDVSRALSALQELDIGCRVEMTGVCIMETESWRPNVIFTKVKGFFIVVRSPADMTVLARPSWWTPHRLLAVIGSLLFLLVGIAVWNVSLQKLVERRGRTLARSAVARAEADLKVYERTRLAVELHDSIAQSLTGISLELRTADRITAADPAEMRRHLHLAEKTLDSCREELRNCLWDLRNMTLDEGDLKEAIRHTLAPHIGNARLSVRFPVPRERISDNTAHMLLRIIRELAVNAVRHGGATALAVAGCTQDGQLLLSVRDNGCGFDPETCPGMDQGHFGLQGIRDRIDNLEGDMRITSSPGRGTRVTIALNIPQENTAS